VVDLPATSIVQSYRYHYYIKFSPIINVAFWYHDCIAVLIPEINIMSVMSPIYCASRFGFGFESSGIYIDLAFLDADPH
jgi:hypothetical protein